MGHRSTRDEKHAEEEHPSHRHNPHMSHQGVSFKEDAEGLITWSQEHTPEPRGTEETLQHSRTVGANKAGINKLRRDVL